MRKDLEWGIKQIKEERTEIANSSYEKDGGDCTTGVIIGLNKALNILSKLDRTETEVDKLDKKIRGLESYNDKLIRDNNQLRYELDNKEVLSEEWIDEHEIHYNHWVGAVPVSDLQNLLVPKQELPVIPAFVADWIEECKGWDVDAQDYDDDNAIGLFSAMDLDSVGMSRPIEDWLIGNTEVFARAWLDGYTVAEEQPQYRIKAGGYYLYFNLDGSVRGVDEGNATISKKRLEQLPFDVEKAIESGIIEVEEVE